MTARHKDSIGVAEHARHPLPAILGIDMAGTVEALGAGVTRFRPGDEVFGMTGGVGGHQGSLAEYAAVDADLLAHKPAHLSMREASVVPLVFITAWEGMVDRMGLRAGQAVLVLGGAGGVGRMAIQIARTESAEVFATGSPGDRAHIEQLGAEFIDRAEPVPAFVARLTGGRGFDLAFDAVGGAVLDGAFAAVRRFGHVASALGWGTHALAPLSSVLEPIREYSPCCRCLPARDVRTMGISWQRPPGWLKLVQLAAALDPRRFTLATVGEAYSAIAGGTARGKLSIDIGQ